MPLRSRGLGKPQPTPARRCRRSATMRPNPAGHTPSARRLPGPASCEPRLRPDQAYLRYRRLPQLRGPALLRPTPLRSRSRPAPYPGIPGCPPDCPAEPGAVPFDCVFRDSAFTFSENSLDVETRRLAWVMTPQGLQIASPEDSLP